MDERQKQLTDLNKYIEGIDKSLTNILENLHWDLRYLLESKDFVSCKHDQNHRIPLTKMEVHEKKCFLKTHGYVDGDILLPDPPENNCMTCIKLGKEELTQIIKTASNGDPTFKKGMGPQGPEPMTLERLHCAYTVDERRAIHDAVVAAAPACHDLSDLALLSMNGDEQKSPKAKSRMEVLAELRDMKRRRTKYRVAAKSRNYSYVLRDVIKTQMEIYKETQDDFASNTIIVGNATTDNAIESNRDSFAEVPQKEMEESHRDNKHRCKSKERFREDSRSRYKHTERYRDEDRSRKNYRETGNDISRNHYQYGKEYKDGDKKFSRAKDEFKERIYDERGYKDEKRRSKSKLRSEDEEGSVDDKRYRNDSQVKYKGRSERKRFEGYHRERNNYSDNNRKDRDVRYRRYYDAFGKEQLNEEGRKWKK